MNVIIEACIYIDTMTLHKVLDAVSGHEMG